MRIKRRRSIRGKLFITYTLLISVIVIGFAAALYSVLLRTYSDAMKNNQVESTRQTIAIVDSFLSEMDTVAQIAAGNPRLLAYFIDLADKDSSGNYFEQNLIDGVDASSILTNINGRQHITDRISAYNDKNDYISAGILYENKKLNDNTLPVTDWIDSAKEKRPLVFGRHGDYWSDSSEPMLSVIRPLSNDYGNISYGIVEVQRQFSRLETLLSFETQQGFIFVIYDENGAPLYTSAPDWSDKNEYGEKSAQNVPVGIQTLPSTTDETAVYGRSSIAQWSIVLIYQHRALYQLYGAAFAVLIGGTLLLLIILVTVVYFIADRLSRPIRELSASIHNIDLHNLHLNLSDLGQDEIDDIQRAFETFVSRLSQSTAMEMEARMFALQSQINPHFLYNSLAVISAAGYENGNEEVADICARLSTMLRYAASQMTAHVTLADELANIQAYLELMKKRYEEDFNYTVKIDGDPSKTPTPKLILQPIVENCFTHGFKGTAPPWHIEVSVEITAAQWKVEITDDGVGMQIKIIDDIDKQLDEYRNRGEFPKLSAGGTGLFNTAIRLFLTYGKQSLFTVNSRLNLGTSVIIGRTT